MDQTFWSIVRPKKIGPSGEVGGLWKVWRLHRAGRTARFLNCCRFCCCLLGLAAACWCALAWRLSGSAELVLPGRQWIWIVWIVSYEWTVVVLLIAETCSSLGPLWDGDENFQLSDVLNLWLFIFSTWIPSSRFPCAPDFRVCSKLFQVIWKLADLLCLSFCLLKLSFVICFNVRLEGSNLTQSCRKRESILLYEWDIFRSLSV